MANPFYVAPPNVSSALQQLLAGYDRGQKATQDMALREAGHLFSQGDIQGAQAAAARGGSLQALMGFSNLANQDRDYQRALTNDARSQSNADRGFGLQERQFAQSAAAQAASQNLQRQQFAWQQEQGNRPDIQLVDDGSGQKVPVLIDRKAGAVRPLPVPGGNAQPNNPFLTGGAMKEDESKAGLYTNRMLNAERVFREPGIVDAAQSVWNKGASNLPGGNYLVSGNFQKYDQAKRDFINATLRRESGAVIADSEFANAEKQYFPQPGDSDAVLKQKQANRIEAIKGIGAGAGKNFRPEYGFDPSGNVVSRVTIPKVGETRQGYRFKGGDPASQDSWVKL